VSLYLNFSEMLLPGSGAAPRGSRGSFEADGGGGGASLRRGNSGIDSHVPGANLLQLSHALRPTAPRQSVLKYARKCIFEGLHVPRPNPIGSRGPRLSRVSHRDTTFCTAPATSPRPWHPARRRPRRRGTPRRLVVPIEGAIDPCAPFVKKAPPLSQPSQNSPPMVLRRLNQKFCRTASQFADPPR